MTTDPTSLIGQQVHFLGPLTVPTTTSIYATAAAMDWGDTLTITDEILESGYDRRRAHWLELVGDESAQIDRFGSVKYGLGPFPDYLPREDPDNPSLATLMNKPYIHKVESVEFTRPVENTLEVGLRSTTR